MSRNLIQILNKDIFVRHNGRLPFTQKIRKFRMECKWKDYFLLPERKFPLENGISWKVVQNSQTEFPNENARSICLFLAELQRTKRASEAPWVSRENLVVTSAYERPSVRTSVRLYRLGGRGRGVSRYSSRSLIREAKERHLSLAVFCLEKSEKHSFLLPRQQTIGEVDLTFQGRV